MTVISAAAVRTITEFSTQGLANTAWAFAVLAVVDMPLLDAIASASIRRLPEFVAQELVNLACAFAGLELVARPMVDLTSQRVSTTVRVFSS